MKIWLDTIDLQAIKEGQKSGLIYGVTTNPSILSKSSNPHQTLMELLELQPGPVAVQVTTKEPEKIIEEALNLFECSKRFIIKIPLIRSGFSAIRELRKRGVPLMGTTVLHPLQALLAANAGVEYIAPYFSHMNQPKETLKEMKVLHPKILAASVKTVEDLLYCASLNIDSATIKADLFYTLMKDPDDVTKFVDQFLQEWEKST